MPQIEKIPMEKSIHISFGGSVVSTPSGYDRDAVVAVGTIFKSFIDTVPVFITIGGGYQARETITDAREHGLSEKKLDALGIAETWKNTAFVSEVFNSLGLSVAIEKSGNYSDALRYLVWRKKPAGIRVTGGTIPGHTTDYVAVQTAVRIQAIDVLLGYGGHHTVVNIGKDGGVFANGSGNSSTIIPEMALADYMGIERFSDAHTHTPGLSVPFDMKAAGLAKKHGISVALVDADPDNLMNLYMGRTFHGTLLTP